MPEDFCIDAEATERLRASMRSAAPVGAAHSS
jgi:hypothetical protein